jgi:rubrerythrin
VGDSKLASDYMSMMAPSFSGIGGFPKVKPGMRRIVTIATTWCVILMVAAIGAAHAGPDATLKNLETAYNGESNAQNKYLACAQQAHEEGYGAAASLFRAAARSNEILLNNQAAIIKKMGAVPKSEVRWPVVGTTWRNLDPSANQNEARELNAMYPEFISQAQSDTNAEAAQAFEYARDAEAQHSKLFAKAWGDLGHMRGKGRTYYVCAVSGFTMETPDGSKCPDGKYETIK